MKKLKPRTRAANKTDEARELAKRFNQVVTSTIAAFGLTPAHTQLYKLCDALRESTFNFAADIIESAIGNSEHVTPSAYILGGLTVLGLYKCELLPTPSQIKVLDRKYHCKSGITPTVILPSKHDGTTRQNKNTVS